jgi:hypothetical protein
MAMETGGWGKDFSSWQQAVEKIAPINLAPQKSPLPLATMSQFTEPVIPDERRFAGRDPESSESDELRHSLLGGEGTCSYPAELS